MSDRVPAGDEAARTLLDRLDVAAVPLRYAQGVDRRDWDQVRSCFTPDARIRGSRLESAMEEYYAVIRESLERYERTMHFMGNQLTYVDGDTAEVETYAIAHHYIHHDVADPGDLVVGVRYQDALVRTGDGWRIGTRVVQPDWTRGPLPELRGT